MFRNEESSTGPASFGVADFSNVDMLGARYIPVNFRAKKASPYQSGANKSPLSIEYGTHRTVKARFRPDFTSKSRVIPSSLGSGLMRQRDGVPGDMACWLRKSHLANFYAGAWDTLSGQPREYLAVGMQIKVNCAWAFRASFTDFKGKQ